MAGVPEPPRPSVWSRLDRLGFFAVAAFYSLITATVYADELGIVGVTLFLITIPLAFLAQHEITRRRVRRVRQGDKAWWRTLSGLRQTTFVLAAVVLGVVIAVLAETVELVGILVLGVLVGAFVALGVDYFDVKLARDRRKNLLMSPPPHRPDQPPPRVARKPLLYPPPARPD